ncbi:patched domain-containing protein 3 [Thalassophryne amazonica]|uniref:patched domain-containing protein 3 n=1 Tax=Thalassophryne amazonica TaxID=390379 RepID=UPI001471D3B2|nr:patched domain-containing protein 3 [Thalassophryne amazonica]
MVCKRTDCVSKPLSHFFEKLGSLVGSYPIYFFVIPLVFSAALGGGFTFLRDREDNDLERQFTPKKGPSKLTRAFVREHFPYNHSMFSKERLYDKGDFASLIAVSTNGSSVLENPAIEDIIGLNDKILNITVDNGTGRLGFKELCAKANGECVANVILDILQSNETDYTGITFPVHSHGFSSVFLGSVIGGVTTNSNESVLSAQAVTLFYFLNIEESMAEARKLWLRGFKQVLSAETEHKHIEVWTDSPLAIYKKTRLSSSVTHLHTLHV